MSKQELLDILQTLSALESWGFSAGQHLPEYLLERLIDSIDTLRREILK